MFPIISPLSPTCLHLSGPLSCLTLFLLNRSGTEITWQSRHLCVSAWLLFVSSFPNSTALLFFPLSLLFAFWFCSIQPAPGVYTFSIVSFLMAQVYRSVPHQEEEEELLASSDAGNEKQWAWKPDTEFLPKRLRGINPQWVWLAHAVLLSISITLFALSFCVKSAKYPGNLLPETYCTYSQVVKAARSPD